MSKKRIGGYSNTMIAYLSEIEDFKKDGWVVLDKTTFPKLELDIYVIGIPDERISDRKAFFMENKGWCTEQPL